MRSLFLTIFPGMFALAAAGQDNVNYLPGKEFNFSTFSQDRLYPKNLASQRTSPEMLLHPEFGKLPYNAACQDCFERLDKRTADERYYEDIDHPSVFYIEKSARPSSFFKDGHWVSIDPRIKPGIQNRTFSAPQQPNPTFADLNLGCTSVKNGSMELRFNRLTLRKKYPNGTYSDESLNTSQFTAGDDGIYIQNGFQGIDIVMRFVEGGIKSEFRLNAPMPGVSEIWIIDALTSDQSFSLAAADGSAFPTSEPIEVRAASGLPVFLYDRLIIWDQSGTKEHNWVGKFDRSLNGDLVMKIDSTILADPSIMYPLIIDPLVNAGPFAFGGTLQGSLLTPAFCSTSMTISFPGGSLPWDFASSWDTRQNLCCTSISCWNSEARVNITSSCGGRTPVAPSWWACPGCNTPGNWIPSLPFSSSGCQSVAQCYPASCLAQNMTFTFNHLRTWCPDAGGCNCTWASNSCGRLQSWSVTVQGRTLEQSIAPSSSNGTTICLGTGTQLTASGSYGVPAYTYLWAPGGQTTQSIWVAPVANTTYTCTITDACGITATNTVLITVNTANTLAIPNIYTYMTPPSGNPCPVVVTFCSNEAGGNDYGGGAETWQWSFPSGTQLSGGATSGSSNGSQYGGAGADATCSANTPSGTAYTVQYNTAGSFWASFTIFKGGSCAVRNIPIVICGALPIELLEFNAVYSGDVVELTWKTASETNNDFFTVERSVDGITFSAIGIVDGAGNSSQELKYSLIDDSPPEGIIYYRLKQTDFDLKESFSDVRSVLIMSGIEEGSFLLIPNPASNIVHAVFLSQSTGMVRLKLFDARAGEVLNEEFSVLAGYNSHSLDISLLKPGTYLLELNSSGKSLKRLMIKK